MRPKDIRKSHARDAFENNDVSLRRSSISSSRGSQTNIPRVDPKRHDQKRSSKINQKDYQEYYDNDDQIKLGRGVPTRSEKNISC